MKLLPPLEIYFIYLIKPGFYFNLYTKRVTRLFLGSPTDYPSDALENLLIKAKIRIMNVRNLILNHLRISMSAELIIKQCTDDQLTV